MKRKLKFCLTLICLFLPGVFIANSQVLVESVAAVVGNEVIYLSDLENTIARSEEKRKQNSYRSSYMQGISADACLKTICRSGQDR